MADRAGIPSLSGNSSKNPPEVSLVIPAYNEAARLPKTLDRILEWLEKSGLAGNWEVIVADDGSSDGTAEVARRPGVRVVAYQPNRGKGYAVRQGVAASTGRLVLVSDADLSTPIEEWTKLSGHLPAGGIAIGSRALDENLIGVFQPWYRRFMGKTFNLFVRMVAMGDFRDTQCGFKLFDGDLARRLFARARIDRFAFDVEILSLARREGAAIVEVPVVWNNVEASRVRVVRDSARMLADLLRIAWIHRGRG